MEIFDNNLNKAHSEAPFFVLRFLQASKGPWSFIRCSAVVYFTMQLIVKMNYINLKIVLIPAVMPCRFCSSKDCFALICVIKIIGV